MIKNQFAPAIGVSKGKMCPKCMKTFGARTLAIHIKNCKQDLKKAKEIEQVPRQSSGSRERRQTLPAKSTQVIFKEEDLVVPNTYESPTSGNGSSVDAKRFSFGMPQEMQFAQDSPLRERPQPLAVNLEPCPKCARKFLPSRLQYHIKCCNAQVVTIRHRTATQKIQEESRPISPISEVVNSINNEMYFKQLENKKQESCSPSKKRRNQNDRQKKGIPKKISQSRLSKEESAFDQNLCNDLDRILDNNGPNQDDELFQGSFNRNKLSMKSNKTKMSVDFQSDGQKVILAAEEEATTLIEDQALEMDTQDFIDNSKNIESDSQFNLKHDNVPIIVSNLQNNTNSSIIIQNQEEIPMHVGPLNLKQCPYCFRNFNEQAAIRHIPVCKNMKNRPKPPPSKYDVYEKTILRQNSIKKVISTLKSQSRTSSQIVSSTKILKTCLELKKIKQTKDTVDELVSSDMLKELQRERESPFLRRESNRGQSANRSFQSKGSFRSSPGRYISPLLKMNSSTLQNIYQKQDSLERPDSKESKKRGPSLIGMGTQVIACLKNQQVDENKYKVQTLSEIKEKRELDSVLKTAKKEWAHSDVKSRMKAFANIQCPQCLRKFSEKAADNHIEYCLQRAKIIPNVKKLQKTVSGISEVSTQPKEKIKPPSKYVGYSPKSKSSGENQLPQRTYYEKIKRLHTGSSVSPFRKSHLKNIPAKINTGLIQPTQKLSALGSQTQRYQTFTSQPSIKLTTGLKKQAVTQRYSTQNRKPSPIAAYRHSSPNLKPKVSFSKFCTNCGLKYTHDFHKFCGDCGRPRVLIS